MEGAQGAPAAPAELPMLYVFVLASISRTNRIPSL